VAVRPVRVLLGLAAAVAATALPGSTAWAQPFASFTHDPGSPLTHQPVNFTSTATTDPGATIVSEEWDLDGDGDFADGSGPTATFTYGRPGTRQVAHRVADSAGNGDTHRERLVIGNRVPVVSFFPVPSEPLPGQPVTFHSTSSDPDGFIAGHAWDLDDDGVFDDAAGSSATLAFPAPGQYRIGLRVSDDAGASNTSVLAITLRAVAEPAGAGPGTAAGAGVVTLGQAVSLARLMSPFPVVRVSGIVRKRGIKLRVLSVNGPVGAIVSVRCRGRGCPFRRQTRTVGAQVHSAAGLAPATGLVRIRRFRRRLLRVGARLKVYVTRPDAIGKYTRLRVRRGRLPARVDRCILPGGQAPVTCPTG
jgi:PKD repeat protein